MSFNNKKTINGIAKYSDVSADILLKSALTASSPTNEFGTATLTENGTVTFSELGMDSSAGGGVTFSAITGYLGLDYEGQIVFEVETNGVAEFDDGAKNSGSTGFESVAATYLVTTRTSTPSAAVTLIMSIANALVFKVNQSDTPALGQMHSGDSGFHTTVCLWWKGTEFGVICDGKPIAEGTRTNKLAGSFHTIHFGSLNTVSSPFPYKIKNVVVSRKSPRFNYKQGFERVGVFGDSFVVLGTNATNVNPYYDANLGNSILRRFTELGFETQVEFDGYSGNTICVTGASDLADHFVAFAANQYPAVVIVAGNNDVTETQAEVEHLTDGTDARYKELIGRCMFLDYPTNTVRSATRKITICTPGSLRQNTVVDTVAYNALRVIVNEITIALPSWWDSLYPAYAGRVTVSGLFATLGGDQDGNTNYQGALDTNTDRHPSGFGYLKLGNSVVNNLL